LHRAFTEAPFLELSLLPGSYRYKVIAYDKLNHPSTETEWSTFEVSAPPPPHEPQYPQEPPKAPPLNFLFWPSWTTLITLDGELNQYLGFMIFPPGPRIGFGMISSGQGYSNGGIELAASWFYLKNLYGEHDINAHLIILDLNLLLQNQSPNGRITLSFRIGMGITVLVEGEPPEEAGNMHPLTGQINTGVSVFWLIKESSYIEAGIDFSHLIGWDSNNLRPWISFGIRF
jgi:hypothetical protein